MVLDKKCKNCGNKILFDPIKQKMSCDYCKSTYEIKEETPEEIKEDSKNLDVYYCPNCGAQIICEPNTTSTFCVYCKNTAILKDKMQGEFYPHLIIPFHTVKQDAINAFVELKKGKKLIPDEFLQEKNIEEIKGIYIPFWFFDIKVNGKMEARGTKSEVDRFLDKTLITTYEYSSIRKGIITYDNIPIDGSTHFQDEIMRSIEPYNYSELKKYSSDYLSGFLSELYDVKKEDAFVIAEKRATQTVNDLFYASIEKQRYEKIDITDSKFDINSTDIQYVLLPVWMLNVKYKDKFYTFAMNGQTKKMIGNIPVDNKKAFKYFLLNTLFGLIITISIAIIIWKVVW